jgi:hypothetical protein
MNLRTIQGRLRRIIYHINRFSNCCYDPRLAMFLAPKYRLPPACATPANPAQHTIKQANSPLSVGGWNRASIMTRPASLFHWRIRTSRVELSSLSPWNRRICLSHYSYFPKLFRNGRDRIIFQCLGRQLCFALVETIDPQPREAHLTDDDADAGRCLSSAQNAMGKLRGFSCPQ